MLDKFASTFAKINRAHQHLNQLIQIINSDEENKAFGINFIHVGLTNELVITALIPKEKLIKYSILAGEIIGQARSALEHAIWEMVPNPNNRTGFPVLRSEEDFQKKGRKMIDGINNEAENLIQSLQPFGADYQANLLYILHELWNTDKHRMLNTCISYPQGIQLIYNYSDGSFGGKHVPVPQPINDGIELFREGHPGPNVQVGAEVAISSVRFYKGIVENQAATEILERLLEFANDTIKKLAATLES